MMILPPLWGMLEVIKQKFQKRFIYCHFLLLSEYFIFFFSLFSHLDLLDSLLYAEIWETNLLHAMFSLLFLLIKQDYKAKLIISICHKIKNIFEQMFDFVKIKEINFTYFVNFLFFFLSVVGLGSWAFHMTLLYEMQLFDELPMVWGTCVLVYCL